MQNNTKQLRFYFITDDGPSKCSIIEQVRIALDAGATMVQYRNKSFSLQDYEELLKIQQVCHHAAVPLLINDHILLAKAIAADGVHLGQTDDSPLLARQILGPMAWLGLSVSSPGELSHTGLVACDYLGCGPVYATGTKPDAQPACQVKGLKAVIDDSPLPVVAIGGISADNAKDCFNHGAAGVAVISTITRSKHPKKAARNLAEACGI